MSKKKETPFFSVIITAYNKAKFLKRALNSLIAQSEKNWEGVIIDDGSEDETPRIAEEYLSLDPRLSYFRQSNKGPGAAKNAGIKSASGKYITFLDADDEYKYNHLKERKALLLKKTDIDLLWGGYEVIGDKLVPNVWERGKKISIDECLVGGTFVIKSELAKELEFPDINFGDDVEFYNRANESGAKIEKINLETYVYRRDTGESICDEINKGKDLDERS